MLIDKALELSNAQAITTTIDSAGKIDLGPNQWAKNSKGSDYPVIPIEVTVDEAFVAAGAGTLTITLRTGPTKADMIAGTNIKTSRASTAIAKTALIPGFRFTTEIPWNSDRWVDLLYTVATGPFTAGKISANVVAARQTNR